jgi:hypothetical protein
MQAGAAFYCGYTTVVLPGMAQPSHMQPVFCECCAAVASCTAATGCAKIKAVTAA